MKVEQVLKSVCQKIKVVLVILEDFMQTYLKRQNSWVVEYHYQVFVQEEV